MEQTKGLDKEIIDILKKSKNPISTNEIAIKTKKSWHSVLTRCLRLQINGRIYGFQAGKMHLWGIKRK